jgi:hypothetical protein
MNENQKKGLIIIVLGILAFFIIPFLLNLLFFKLLNLYYDWVFISIRFIPILVSVGLIVYGIITLFKKVVETNESQANIIQPVIGDCNHNKIVNITLWGGLLGLFASSPKQKIAKAIEKENLNGFRVVQVIEAASGNLFLWLLRLIILIITIFIYTPANGYYITFEKIKDGRI